MSGGQGMSLAELEAQLQKEFAALSEADKESVFGGLPLSHFATDDKLDEEDNIFNVRSAIKSIQDFKGKGGNIGQEANPPQPLESATGDGANTQGKSQTKGKGKQAVKPKPKSTSKSKPALPLRPRREVANYKLGDTPGAPKRKRQLSTSVNTLVDDQTSSLSPPPSKKSSATSGSGSGSGSNYQPDASTSGQDELDKEIDDLINDDTNDENIDDESHSPKKRRILTSVTPKQSQSNLKSKFHPKENTVTPKIPDRSTNSITPSPLPSGFPQSGPSTSGIMASGSSSTFSPIKSHSKVKWTSLAGVVNKMVSRWQAGKDGGTQAHYAMYDKPFLIPESKYGSYNLTVSEEESDNCWMGFKCSICQNVYKQRAWDNSGGSLRSHYFMHQKPKTLMNAIGNNAFDNNKLLFNSVISVALHNRSFSSINDLLIQQLVAALPNPLPVPSPRYLSTLSKDFVKYCREPIFKTVRKEMIGKLHIAVDGWSSPNHGSYLAVIGSWLVKNNALDRGYSVKTCVIDFIHSDSSTGASMATQIESSLEAVKLDKSLFSVTLDNTSANDVLIEELGANVNLPNFPGPPHRIMCFAHILNLVVKAVLSPFASTTSVDTFKKYLKRSMRAEQVKLLEKSDQHNIDLDEEVTFLEDSPEDEDPDEESGEDPDVTMDQQDNLINNILDGQSDAGTESSIVNTLADLISQVTREDVSAARGVLRKARRLARTTTLSTKFRNLWERIIKKLTDSGKYSGPNKHIKRDIEVRWNTTGDMINDCLDMRIIINEFYSHPEVARDRTAKRLFSDDERLNDRDWETMEALKPLLTWVKQATLIFEQDVSHTNGPVTVAMVVPYIDQLTLELDKILTSNDAPLMVKVGIETGKNVLNKYYSRTDESNLYRIGILLHPSMKMKYLERNKWLEDWREMAKKALLNLYNEKYKPNDLEAAHMSSPPADGRPVMSFDDGDESMSKDPVEEFISSGIVRGKGNSYQDPLEYWFKNVDFNLRGLRDLALDVFTAPASWYRNNLVTFTDWEKFMRERERN